MSEDQSHQLQTGLAKLRMHRVAVIDFFNDEPIDVYLYLRDRFESAADCSRDTVFQFLFRSHYRLDNAGLSVIFKAAYFGLLEKNRGVENVDLECICPTLISPRNSA
jgi:hypothetical protein